MILAYEFEYISKNLVLENFLKVISEEFGARYKICKNDNITTLYISENEEKQHAFADYLSSNLPISIFLKSSNVKAVKDIKCKELDFASATIALPFSKSAIEIVKNKKSFFYKSPFISNEITSSKINQKVSLSLKSEKGIMVANNSQGYENIYKTIAKLIKKGQKIKIKTPNGYFAFFNVQKDAFKNLKKFEILPTDISLVQKMVNIRENEIQALLSVEKPIIRAKVNMIYEALEILPTNRIKIRMPNIPLLYFICKELYENGIEFLAKSDTLIECSYDLNYDLNVPKIPDIEVSILENGEIFVLSNSGYNAKSFENGLEKFKEPSIRQFASILKERKLFDAKTSCFYFSTKFDDSIMYHDTQKGILPLTKFPISSTLGKLFDEIRKEDDTGAKLIENYKKTYPKIFKSALRVKIPTKLSNNLFNTLRFASIIIGLSDNFKKAADALIEKAEDFGGQKGVRIDFGLVDNEKIYSDFNFRRLLRSLISFKLAGTDYETLSFGIIENFSYFISDMADSHKEVLGSDKIALGGSIFGYPLITQLVAKNLLANHKIYFNQELPIDFI
ncbi:MAG: hypothetical protein GXP61_06870 [Epsilonproteobacteria bacterium]|nr:hypothetical protein [Campylobacterota bacterium]